MGSHDSDTVQPLPVVTDKDRDDFMLTFHGVAGPQSGAHRPSWVAAGGRSGPGLNHGGGVESPGP